MNAKLGKEVAKVLESLFRGGAEEKKQYSWQSYFAPQSLDGDLMNIGRASDPSHLGRVKEAESIVRNCTRYLTSGILSWDAARDHVSRGKAPMCPVCDARQEPLPK